MQELYAYLEKHPVVYVTRDRERAEGLSGDTRSLPAGRQGYSIISDPNKSTRELVASLENPESAAVLIFKANRQVEETCRAKNWRLLNPPATLAEQVEGKVSQIKWLGSLSSHLPSHWEGLLADCPWPLPFVLQWNWGHSGEGTRLIETNEQLGELIKQFPYRKVRVSKFIDGDTFTNNNIVTKDRVLVGNISYQITGDPELTDNPFATVGNDWGKALELLSSADRQKYNQIATKIGEKLRDAGWKGAYGVDIMRERGSGKMYLIEVNARQSASVVFESNLQSTQRSNLQGRIDLESGVTVFEAHLAALVGLDLSDKKLIPITNGRRTINRKNII